MLESGDLRFRASDDNGRMVDRTSEAIADLREKMFELTRAMIDTRREYLTASL